MPALSPIDRSQYLEFETTKLLKRHFIHEIGEGEGGQIIEVHRNAGGKIESKTSFDATTYSLMKHGHPGAIRQAAEELFRYIIADSDLFKNFLESDVAVTNSAREVPTASFTIMKVLVEGLLNPYLEKRTDRRVLWVRSERGGEIAASDYGTMSKEERIKRITERKPFFSKDNEAKLIGKKVILFDDLVATGTYEAGQSELLRSAGVPEESIFKLYWIQVEPKTGLDPAFEAKVNYAAIRSISDLLKFFYAPDLVINERTLKYILPILNMEGIVDETKVKDLMNFFRSLGEPTDAALTESGRSTLRKIWQTGQTKDNYRQMERLRAGYDLLESYLAELALI